MLREWLPNATSVQLIGDMTNWEKQPEFHFQRLNERGDWQLVIDKQLIQHGQEYRLKLPGLVVKGSA